MTKGDVPGVCWTWCERRSLTTMFVDVEGGCVSVGADFFAVTLFSGMVSLTGGRPQFSSFSPKLSLNHWQRKLCQVWQVWQVWQRKLLSNSKLVLYQNPLFIQLWILWAIDWDLFHKTNEFWKKVWSVWKLSLNHWQRILWQVGHVWQVWHVLQVWLRKLLWCFLY